MAWKGNLNMEWRLNLEKAASAVSGSLINADKDELVKSVITDSRKAEEGAVFVALRGEHSDGHEYVEKAISNGAVCAIVEKGRLSDKNIPLIEVENTLRALGDLAAAYRSEFSLPCVAVTGSVGKTSTRDMIHSVLSEKYNTLKTSKNYNNEIGLPLTVFGLNSEHEMMVLEMGMSGFGEISRLAEIAKPETAVITNIGLAHIEKLGSRENILKAKLEIIEGMNDDGAVILNGDDPLLWKLSGTLPYETLYYGIENKACDLIAEDIKKYSSSTEFRVKIDGEEYKFETGVPGGHHVYNALAAILIGIRYSVPIKSIAEGVKKFVPDGLRQNIISLKDYVIIKDCYNASPDSMKSGIEVLEATLANKRERKYKRTAVLGDMLELGDISAEEHRKIGALVAKHNVDRLITVGKMAEFIAKGAIEEGFSASDTFSFPDNESVIKNIYSIIKPGDIILFKGSRGMKLEEIADYLAQTNGIAGEDE